MDFNLQDVADIPEEQDTEDTEEGSEEEEGEVNDGDGDAGGKRGRGKDKSWSQIGMFTTNEEFKGSEIHSELTKSMRKDNPYDTEDFKMHIYVCKHFKKQGWKSCPRRVRVGYDKSSSGVTVWQVDDSDHNHELMSQTILTGCHYQSLVSSKKTPPL